MKTVLDLTGVDGIDAGQGACLVKDDGRLILVVQVYRGSTIQIDLKKLSTLIASDQVARLAGTNLGALKKGADVARAGAELFSAIASLGNKK